MTTRIKLLIKLTPTNSDNKKSATLNAQILRMLQGRNRIPFRRM